MLNLKNTEILLDSNSQLDVEKIRNVKVILTTLEGEVPYDRGFGISLDVLDLPLNEAQDLYTAECLTKIRKYEPDVRVEDVSFTYEESEGKFYPKVVLSYEPE
ncbi:hypothetical protein [Psychrobacillus sp.]|uniref:hypothetical protein n=1 Tax=Psychrobacillus sp. TaxID=1871623 RepID=UPI0028BE4DD1|nr:hypothetical protein [Psychrobacillus sp.]